MPSSIYQLSSEQRYQLLVDHAVEHALIVTDEKGTITDWSAGAERLLGWPAAEAVGQPFAMIFTPEDRAANAPQAELHTAQTLGRASDVRWHLRRDGSEVFCDGMVNKLHARKGGPVLGYGKILREAYSTRKDQPGMPASATSEQRSFLAAVLESVESGIVACDRQGKLTFFNEAAQEIHGLQVQPLSVEQWTEHYGMYRPDGLTPLPADEIPLHRALHGERVEDARIVVRTPDGRSRDIEVTGRPLRDGGGQILGAVISMQDVTARGQVHEAREEAAREQGKRVRAEASNELLRKAEEQLRVAADAARLGIWTWEVASDLGSWENDRMYRIFDVPEGRQIVEPARLIAGYLHPDDAVAFRQATEQTLRHGRRFEFTGRVRRKNSAAPRWIELTGELAPRLNGGQDVIIGTAADISERVEIEQTLEEARLRLDAALAAGEVGTWIWDIREDRLKGDDNLARLFGVSRGDVDGVPLSTYLDAIDREDLDEVRRRIQHALETGEPYFANYRITHPQAGQRWLSARGRVAMGADGRPAMLAGVILNITEQKEAQEALQIAEERYRTLITSMDEAFAIVQVILDDEGKPVDYRFEQVNRAIEQQSGLVDAAGKTIREMVPGIESRWIELYGRVALTREPIRFTEHSAAMGYWWDVYATPVGRPEERRIAILFTDITARRQAEEKLRQTAADLSETNRRKTEFLATLAHELRNPLAPIRTGLDLMRMGGKDAKGGGRMLEMMDRQLKQMVHLIDDLMDVSRINSGKIALKKARIDIKLAVANAVETAMPAIRAARHDITIDIPGHPVEVDADATRLAQILSNLLTNAVKYTPNGGRISLSVREADDCVVVTVSDTGMGIPEEEQKKVFDMFSQVSRNMGRAQGGLGIGLSLVRSLVAMHGGSIDVSSPGAGLGATFTVKLPGLLDSQAAMQVEGEAPDAHDAGHESLRILVADDNVDAALMLAALLQASGHQVETVHDGMQAVRRIGEFEPDVAILDIGMPGLNGYEVASRVRAQSGKERIVLIALTGWGGELDRSRSDEAGFDAHLTKPAGLDELNRLMARIVVDRQRRPGDN